jgi:hypothetical protein
MKAVAEVFQGSRKSAAPRTRWQVWYDPPAPKLRFAVAARQNLTMQMTGKVSGLRTNILADSGASDVFVSLEFAKRAGLLVSSAGKHTQVTLGDDSPAVEVSGTCTVPLRAQGYRGKVKAFVLGEMLEVFDLILGDNWLRDQGALMDFRLKRILLRQNGHSIALQCSASLAEASSSKVQSKVISALQTKRMLRKATTPGDHIFLVHVTQVNEGQDSMQNRSMDQRDWDNDPLLIPKPVLQATIERYMDVLPAWTPPDRGIGHTIPLIPGAGRPPSRPLYRLSALEMAEVER